LLGIVDGIELQKCRPSLLPHVEKAHLEILTEARPRMQHPNIAVAELSGLPDVGIVAQLMESDEIGVRVEHHERQFGAQQQLLEQHTERIGLARSALPTPKRVSVEPSCPYERGAGGVHSHADRNLACHVSSSVFSVRCT